MAWRNVWRSRRRSLVTIFAMGFALLVMMLYAGLMQGYLEQLEKNVLELEIGDMQVFAPEYRTAPSLYERIAEPEQLLGELERAGFPASGRLLGFGLAAVGEASAGVSLRGVDVTQERSVSLIHERIEQGEWLDESAPRDVVLGWRLARSLSAAPGDELMVLSQGLDGAMAADLYRVGGVLQSVSDFTDRAAVFMTARAFRELMGVEDGVHQIVVRRVGDVELDAAASEVAGAAPGLDVRTWRQLLPTLASMLDSARGAMYIMFVVVYLAVAILILNATLMAVFERLRELGVMKALGVGPVELLVLVFSESLIQVALAIVLGLGLGIPGLWYLERVGLDLGMLAGTSVMGMSMETIWYASISGVVFAGPIGILVFIVVVAVAYPALRAARIEPVEAMRHR